MKIAYILSTFPSLSETFILREMDELYRLGLDVRVFALARGDAPGLHAEAECFVGEAIIRPPLSSWSAHAPRLGLALRRPARTASVGLANLIRGGLSRFGALRAAKACWSAAYFASHLLRLGIDHVHAGWSDYPARVGYLASRLTGLPFSFAAHARDIFVCFSPFWHEHLRHARFATVCSDYGRRFIEERLGGEARKLHRLYHGVNIPSFESLLRQSAPAGPGAPLLLSVGRDVPKKGFSVLAQAYRLLRERGVAFRATIIGPHEPGGAAESLCRQHDLPVTWTGPMPQPDVAAAMAQASMLVVPSVVADDGDRDGLPNVILEAMVARLPVVASRLGGIPEAVIDRETGILVEPGNPQELADRIEVLLRDDALRVRLGERGRVLVAERFDLQENVAELAALFAGTHSG